MYLIETKPLFYVNDQNGASAIVVAIVGVFALVGIAALSIDVGFIFGTKNELQNIADGAALAGARELGAIYQPLPYSDQQGYVLTSAEQTTIKDTAKAVALQNKAGGKANIVVNDEDIIIGLLQDREPDGSCLSGTQPVGDYCFDVTITQPTAVTVIARRDSAANSPVSTFFARIFKIFGSNFELVNVTADATAALTGQSEAGEGGLPIPVGISEWWFDNNACRDEITFYPANDPSSCAGWTTYTYSPSNDPKIQDLITGDLENPAVSYGEDLGFTGGTLSDNTFSELLLLFMREGYDAELCGTPPCPPAAPGAEVPLYDCGPNCTTGERLYYPEDGPPYKDDTTRPRNYHNWEASVIVYESNDCANPNQTQKLVGFARVTVTDVYRAPDKTIKGIVLCNFVEPGDSRGGGGNFGTLGSIPGLVE
ncbi:pilus assembly protein TadG-related protein [Candidatus Moduliflexota bacterium]